MLTEKPEGIPEQQQDVLPHFSAVMSSVRLERLAQEKKWGQQRHNVYKWLAILMEEVGEASEAALEGDTIEFCVEMTQVAAVAVSILEALRDGRVE